MTSVGEEMTVSGQWLCYVQSKLQNAPLSLAPALLILETMFHPQIGLVMYVRMQHYKHSYESVLLIHYLIEAQGEIPAPRDDTSHQILLADA